MCVKFAQILSWQVCAPPLCCDHHVSLRRAHVPALLVCGTRDVLSTRLCGGTAFALSTAVARDEPCFKAPFFFTLIAPADCSTGQCKRPVLDLH